MKVNRTIINKELVVLSVGKALQVLIALASIKILTELLSEEEVGNYYLLLTLLTLFNFAFLNPLGQYFSRHLIQWQNSNNLLNATLTLMGLRLFAIFFAILVAYAIYLILDYSKYYGPFEFLLFLFISLLAGAHGVLLNAVNILGDRIEFVKYLLMTLCVSLCLALLITIFEKSALGWLYGFAFAQLFFLFFLYKHVVSGQPFVKNKILAAFQTDYIKKVALFIAPITVTLFLQWGQNTSYRFIIETKYSIETLAFIGVGISIATAVFGAVESLANQYYNPIYFRRITGANKKERAAAWNDLAKEMIPIYVLLVFLVIATAPYLATLLVAKKFFDAYIYTVFGVLIEFFRVMTNLVYLVSQSEVKTGKTVFPYGVGFTLTIALLYLFDFSEKLWLIPAILSITQALIMVLMYTGMKKILQIKLDIISILKAILWALPFLFIFVFECNKMVSQALAIIIPSGIYFLIVVYIITEKKRKVV